MIKLLYGAIIGFVITTNALMAKDLNLQDIMQMNNKKDLQATINSYPQNTGDYDKEFTLGVLYHNLAKIENDIKISENAKNILEKANELYKEKNNKEDPLILMYLGSANTLNGRDSGKIMKKVSFVNLGLAQMDRAVSLDSTNILLRVIRSSNNVELPSMFSRLTKIMEDLKFIEDNDVTKQYTKDLQMNYYSLAKQENNKELKKQYLDKAYALDQNSEIAKQIK